MLMSPTQPRQTCCQANTGTHAETATDLQTDPPSGRAPAGLHRKISAGPHSLANWPSQHSTHSKQKPCQLINHRWQPTATSSALIPLKQLLVRLLHGHAHAYTAAQKQQKHSICCWRESHHLLLAHTPPRHDMHRRPCQTRHPTAARTLQRRHGTALHPSALDGALSYACPVSCQYHSPQ